VRRPFPLHIPSEVSDTRIYTGVALLKASDQTIAAHKTTIAELAITIRHVKALLDQADSELAEAPRLANESVFDHLPD
jgi:hypothetical protein